MPEDFDGIQGKTSTGHQAARIANARIEKLLGPEVFGYANTNGGFMYVTDRYEFSTHRARLFGVTEIAKAECDVHIPKVKSRQPIGIPICDEPMGAALILGCDIVCAKCGAKLVAKWEVAGE